MTPDPVDLKSLATCIWKEARSLGYRGMTAVACVVKNRVDKQRIVHPSNGMTVAVGQPITYTQIIDAPHQFSSMDHGDPQYRLVPPDGDPQWSEAQDIASDVIEGDVADITGDATLYYATYIPFPASWDKSKIVHTIDIGNMRFFRELA